MERITINPDVCHGKPTIRGSRLMVATILELLASGMSYEDIINDYPALELEDIYACLTYAAQLSRFKTQKIVA